MRLLRSAAASRIPPANGAEYPRGQFGEAMRQTTQLIRANVGLEVAFADTHGWDTHVGQGAEQGQLAARLREFGEALAAFAQDLGDRMADVVVLTMSEFGRTVRENGNRGTDHGHATAMLVLGGGVRGGRVYGRWPGLAREQLFERRDLAVTTDFRTLFSEVALHHLRVSAPLFPGWPGSAPRSASSDNDSASRWQRRRRAGGVRCASGRACVTVRASWATTLRSCATARSRPSR